MKFTRPGLNFLVDAFILLLFVALLWLTAVTHFIFPHGAAGESATLWGVGYSGWNALYLMIMAMFGLGVLLHLILHWTWVCSFVSSRVAQYLGRKSQLPPDGVRTLYGVGVLAGVLVLLGVLLALAQLQIHVPRSHP